MASRVYGATGSWEEFDVPNGVTEVTVTLIGAAGGTSSAGIDGVDGGKGGYIEATLSVDGDADDTLHLFVGFGGNTGASGGVGAFSGGDASGNAGSGAGSTAVRLNGQTASDEIVTAGGGGGGSDSVNGGGGGAEGGSGGTADTLNGGSAGGDAGGTDGTGGDGGDFGENTGDDGTGNIDDSNVATVVDLVPGGGAEAPSAGSRNDGQIILEWDRPQNVPSKGWFGALRHPTTGRWLTAEPLTDPRIEPSLNSLPKFNFPVPRADYWQELNDGATFHVYLDGMEQPIDELIDVQDRRSQAASVLIGRGGVELLDTAQVEFDSERRHLAAQQVIQNQTPYDDDVAAPSVPVISDDDRQDPTSTSDFNSVSDFDNDEPVEVKTDQVDQLQTLFFTEGEEQDRENGTTIATDSTYSGDAPSDGLGSSRRVNASNEWLEYDFTTEHVIPESDFGVQVRIGATGDAQEVEFKITLSDGTVQVIDSLSGGESLSTRWNEITGQAFTTTEWTSGDVPAGTHTLRIEATGSSGSEVDIDCVAFYDKGDRFGGFGYNFDNSVEDGTDGGRYLQGPELFPDRFGVEFSPSLTPFSVIAGDASVSMNDTTENQRLQIRNDITGSYEPSDGTEDNTTSVDVSFSSAGDRIQIRVGCSRFGSRDNTTPLSGFNGQVITSYDLDADIRQEGLLLDYSEDDTVEKILNDICGDQFVWSYDVVNGTKTVKVTQPGQRTSGTDPSLIKADPNKDLDTYHEVTVIGANKAVNGEQFSASNSFVNLTEGDIVPGSESVSDQDTGEQFSRGDDYEMNWRAGEIRATDDGGLVTSDTYQISYRAEVRGTFTEPSPPSGYRSLPVNIPEVVSGRNAEQIAYVLVQDLKDPRWIIDITIPPSAATFDAIEALPLVNLDIPSGAGPFFPIEEPKQTPEGTEFRLVSQFDQQRRVVQIKRQVNTVVRRTG